MAGKQDPFKRSEQMRRSPVVQSKSVVLDPTAQTCSLCEALDNLEMVECETCKQWFHFVCVNIKNVAECEKWSCQPCQAKQPSTESHSKQDDSVVKTSKLKSATGSSIAKSTKTTSSAARKQKLALERIEEERKLRESREQAYIKEKEIREKKLLEEKEARDKELLQEKKVCEEARIKESLKMQTSRDQEYLDNKYSALDQLSEGTLSEPDSQQEEDNRNSERYTSEWVENQYTSTNPLDWDDQDQNDLIDPLQPLDKQPEHVARTDVTINMGQIGTTSSPCQTNKEKVNARQNDQFGQSTKADTIHAQWLRAQQVHSTDQVSNGNKVVFQPPQTWNYSKFTPTQHVDSSGKIPSNYVKLSTIPENPGTSSCNVQVKMTNPTSTSQHVTTARLPELRFRTVCEESKTSTSYHYQPPMISTSILNQPSKINNDRGINIQISNTNSNVSTYQSNPIFSSGNYLNRHVGSGFNDYQPFSNVNSGNKNSQTFLKTSSSYGHPPVSVNPEINTHVGFGYNDYQPFSNVSSGYTNSQTAPKTRSSYVSIDPGTNNQNRNTFTNHTSSPPIVNTVYTSQSCGTAIKQNESLSIGNQIPNISGLTDVSCYEGWSTALSANQIASRHAMPKGLPKFSGKPEEWTVFRGAYINSTRACGYSNVENLGRLTDCLKDDAKDSVNFMLVNPDLVPQAMQTLEMMYGRTDLIIETLMEKIQQLTSLKENDLNALIKFAITVKNLSEHIKLSDSIDHLQNPTLIRTLVDKLPTQMKINWAMTRCALPTINIATFGNWLYGIAQMTSQIVGKPKVEISKKDDKGNIKSSRSKSNHINAQVNYKTFKQQDQSSETNLGTKSELNQENGGSKSCQICGSTVCKQVKDCKKFLSLNKKERWETVVKNKICGYCLGNHRYFKCTSRGRCTAEGCKAKHHLLLHDEERQISKAANSTRLSTSQAGNLNSHQRLTRSPAIFRIVPIKLYFRKQVVCTFAYLDDGSDLTLMERELATELGLFGTPEVLSVKWAFGQTEENTNTEIVSVRISGSYTDAKRYEIAEAFTVDKLHLPSQSISSEWLESYPHLKDLPISTYTNATPRMLIGLYSSYVMVSLETKEGEPTDPIACKTRLGWVVQGPDGNDSGEQKPKSNVSMNMGEKREDAKLHQLVKEFFSFESFGVRVSEISLESKDVERAKKILETTTIEKNGRYTTGLLWRYDDVHLPDSYPMAVKRLECLENKMKKEPSLATKLCDQMRDFVEKKYIRKLQPSEVATNSPRLWYLPIFVVYNPKKPLKVRTVWDAAARVKNVSLNSVLLKGPDELIPLTDVLRRFRERRIAFTGDLKEMFHQIRIRKEDQYAQRFLWRDGETDRNPDVYVMEVMTFGATCSPSSAQFVKNENAKKFKDKFPKAVEAILDNHYIDDMLECAHTVEDAIHVAKDVQFIHKQASFEMNKFSSNSNEFLVALGEKVESTKKNLNLNTNMTTERVLGMFWNTLTDMFTFSLKYQKIAQDILVGNRRPTKREVLRALMSIFDPLGLIANILVYAKILLQKIWRKSTNWDEPISESLHEDWLIWIKLLPVVEQLQIPRLYSTKMSPNDPKSIQLHIFVDASLEACAAVIYIRVEDEEGVECSLVGAKTKVAPNKPLTVPRLELQAAVLGTRLVGSVGKSQRFPIVKRYFWSDSKTVLSWIMSETRKYNQFVAFRVGEILESSDEVEWNWVSTNDNVADEATKWKNKPDIESSSRWFKGPSFLYQPENEWKLMANKSEYNTNEELRPRYLLAHFHRKVRNVITPEEFSSWRTLLRVQALVLRYVNNLKLGKHNRQVGPITRVEFVCAQNHLYRQAQMDRYTDEITIIRHNASALVDQRKEFDKSSPLISCSPYLDDHGVLRIKGRIDAAKSLTIQTKRPIILPRDHHITKLIVLSYHVKYHHMNHQTTLNEVNQKFYISALRRVLKGVIQNKCQRCKNDRANPVVPEMSELPPARLATFTRPYTFAGIDYFGPMYIRVNRSKVKRWGVLVTCLTTRAIHIEVAHSLNTSSCIMAVRNFMNRRGTPAEIYSDNGTNFHGSDNELRDEFQKLNLTKIQVEFTGPTTQWNFNPPLASHMGGSWERLIRTVKSIRKKTMPNRLPSEEMLQSFLIEAENIINSRPLTYVALDHSDDEILTPNHFLLGSSNGVRSPGEFNERHLLRNNWQSVQEATNQFWRRFNIEYLPTLTRRTKWFQEVKQIEIGDVVIIVDDKNERNTWPRGIVEEVIRSKDGQVRQAYVRVVVKPIKLDDKPARTKLYLRPVAKLAILDVRTSTSDPVCKDVSCGLSCSTKTSGAINEEECYERPPNNTGKKR